jgi:hypothetical protein
MAQGPVIMAQGLAIMAMGSYRCCHCQVMIAGLTECPFSLVTAFPCPHGPQRLIQTPGHSMQLREDMVTVYNYLKTHGHRRQLAKDTRSQYAATARHGYSMQLAKVHMAIVCKYLKAHG